MAPLMGGLAMLGPALGIGAVAALALYLMKDRDPDEQWFQLFSGSRSGKNAAIPPLTSQTTAFGQVGVSGWEDLAGDGSEFAQKVTETVVALDAQLAQYLTQAQIDAAKAAIAGTVAGSGAFDGDADLNSDQATAQALKQRYATLFGAIDQGIADQILAAADSTEAVGQAIIEGATKLAHERLVADLKTALGSLGTAVRGMTNVRATAYSAPTIEAQLQSSAQAIYAMLGSLDASVESHQQLLGMVQDRYQLEVQYLTQIAAISTEISATLDATAEAIRTSLFTDQQTYDYWKEMANNAAASIGGASTASEVQAIVAELNRATQSAWQSLAADPTAQPANQQAFLDFLDQVDTLAQSRLTTFEETLQTDAQALRDSVNWNLDQMAIVTSNLTTATVTMERAAQQLAAAAQAMPSTITVDMAGAYA